MLHLKIHTDIEEFCIRYYCSVSVCPSTSSLLGPELLDGAFSASSFRVGYGPALARTDNDYWGAKNRGTNEWIKVCYV